MHEPDGRWVRFHLAAHAGMAGFRWDGVADGEDLGEGILAIGRYSAAHSLAAFECDSFGDSYYVGVIDAQSQEALAEIAARLSFALTGVRDND